MKKIIERGTSHEWVMMPIDKEGIVDTKLWDYHFHKMERIAQDLGYILPNWEESIRETKSERAPSYVKGYCVVKWHCHLHKFGDPTGDYILHYPSLRIVRKEVPEDYHCLSLKDEPALMQVNASYSCIEDKTNYWISGYNEDGFVGRTQGTVYSDGVDYTDWCLFVGTQEECQQYIANR